jgi:hypothetical protein
MRSAVVNAVGNGLYSAVANLGVLKEQGLGAYAQAVGGSVLEGGIGGLASGGFTNVTGNFLVGTTVASVVHSALNSGDPQETANGVRDNSLTAITLGFPPGGSVARQIGVVVMGNVIVGITTVVVQKYSQIVNAPRPVGRPVPTLMPIQSTP